MPSAALSPRPQVAPPAQWEFPRPRRVDLASGLRVDVAHLPGQQVATVIVALHLPLEAEPEGMDGLAALMARCLGATTRYRSSGQFRQALAGRGITWTARTTRTGPRVICDVTTDTLPIALALLAEAVAEPVFTPKDAARQVQHALAALAQDSADPHERVCRELTGLLFEPSDRRARPIKGSPDTLMHLAAGDLSAFHAAHAHPQHASVAIAGDLPPSSELDTAIGDAFTPWRPLSPASPLPPASPPAEQPPGAAVLIDQPATPQTHLAVVAPTVGPTHRDWPALSVAAHILGAPIIGRLDARLREQRGYSYGVRSDVDPSLPGVGIFTAGGAVAAEHTTAAVSEMLAILDTAHSEGFTNGEVADARDGLARIMPLAYETPAAVAGQITDLHTQHLPLDVVTTILARLRALTTEQVNQAMRTHLDPRRLGLVAVGPAASVAQPLREIFPQLRVESL